MPLPFPYNRGNSYARHICKHTDRPVYTAEHTCGRFVSLRLSKRHNRDLCTELIFHRLPNVPPVRRVFGIDHNSCGRKIKRIRRTLCSVSFFHIFAGNLYNGMSGMYRITAESYIYSQLFGAFVKHAVSSRYRVAGRHSSQQVIFNDQVTKIFHRNSVCGIQFFVKNIPTGYCRCHIPVCRICMHQINTPVSRPCGREGMKKLPIFQRPDRDQGLSRSLIMILFFYM